MRSSQTGVEAVESGEGSSCSTVLENLMEANRLEGRDEGAVWLQVLEDKIQLDIPRSMRTAIQAQGRARNSTKVWGLFFDVDHIIKKQSQTFFDRGAGDDYENKKINSLVESFDYWGREHDTDPAVIVAVAAVAVRASELSIERYVGSKHQDEVEQEVRGRLVDIDMRRLWEAGR